VEEKCYSLPNSLCKRVEIFNRFGGDGFIVHRLYCLRLFFSNPDEFLKEEKDWREMTTEERQASNEKHRSVYLDSRYDYERRNDPILIQVVEELGEEAASGKLAELKIVDIPNGIKWEIDDYDGIETVHEQHASW